MEGTEEYKKYVVEKGSIAIDGISLTVVKTSSNAFEVAIIPHSLENTILNDSNINIKPLVNRKYGDTMYTIRPLQ